MGKFLKKSRKSERGFILNFTLLFVGAMLLIVVVSANSTLALLTSARNELKSLKAYYAADSGIECASFLNDKYRAFDTTSTSSTYSCGFGNSFTVGGGANPPTACATKTYESIEVGPLDNGACVTLHVEVKPQIGNPQFCRKSVLSKGFSSCATSSANVAERTRWKDM